MRPFFAITILSLLACTGGGSASDPSDTAADAGNDEDVRGIYAVTWSDTFTVQLDLGGAVQEATTDGTDVVTFTGPDGEPLELDVGAWCADPAVNCPSEAWPARVAIDEDAPDSPADWHTLHAWNADADSTTLDGLVSHADDTFLFGLDGGSGSSGSCGAVGLSAAGGTFTYDGSSVTGIVDGQVADGWLAVCAWDGLAVAATLSLSTEFSAVREGPLDTDTGG